MSVIFILRATGSILGLTMQSGIGARSHLGKRADEGCEGVTLGKEEVGLGEVRWLIF